MQLAACSDVLIIIGRLLLNMKVCSNFSVYISIYRHNFPHFVKVQGLLSIPRDILLDIFLKQQQHWFKSEEKQFSSFLFFFPAWPLKNVSKVIQRVSETWNVTTVSKDLYISVRHFSKLKSSNYTSSKYINSHSKNKRTKNWTGKNSCQNS